MNITREQIGAIMPYAKQRADQYVPWLNRYMPEFGIATPLQAAMFLAQLAHESGEFRYVRELASGQDYDTGAKAKALGNTPEADGDGQRFKGHGLIQITGKKNHAACGLALGIDLIAHPEQLEAPQWAVASACWFWQANGLGLLADKGDLYAVTRRINGGLNGIAERAKYYARAKTALGVKA